MSVSEYKTMVPILSDLLDGLELQEVTEKDTAYMILSSKKNVMAKQSCKKEFLAVNINTLELELQDKYVFWDFKVPTYADMITNISFKNVHHYDFLSNGVVFGHFPNELVLAAMPFSEAVFRLFFERNNVPASFSVGYDLMYVPINVRKKLCEGCETTHQRYAYGIIAQK